jgi:hypothetical protein
MPCEPYKNALTEASATGAEPQNELHAHLAACPSCHAAFVEEQQLFTAITAGLHASANAEVPASLLPRVRACIAEEATSKRGWTPSLLAIAGAAAMVVAFITARAVWRTNFEQTPVRTATNASTPAPVVPPPQSQDPNAVTSVSKNSVSQPRTVTTRNPVRPEAPATRATVPEVLVPRDQEALLVNYAEQWSQRKRAPLVAANSDATNLSPLQIAPIQIAQLDVKLMTEEQDQ